MIGALALVLAPAASATPHDARLAGVTSFAFGIGSGGLEGDVAARYAPFDLVVVDGEEATPEQIAQLHASGKLVLGYLSIGTIEPGRSWYRSVRRYRLDRWADFDEWYADVRAPGYRRVLGRRVAPAILRKGFDGLFLDNVDMVETHPRQRGGMRALVRSIAAHAHGGGAVVFAQNGDDSIRPLVRYLDGWNREDVTSTYDFDDRRYELLPGPLTRSAQRALRRMSARGLLVTATDYVAEGDGDGERLAVANACDAGALPYVADIGLTRVPAQAFRCPATVTP